MYRDQVASALTAESRRHCGCCTTFSMSRGGCKAILARVSGRRKDCAAAELGALRGKADVNVVAAAHNRVFGCGLRNPPTSLARAVSSSAINSGRSRTEKFRSVAKTVRISKALYGFHPQADQSRSSFRQCDRIVIRQKTWLLWDAFATGVSLRCGPPQSR